MELAKNQEYQSEIIGYTNQGNGIARINDAVVFIPGAISGETCKFKILKVTKNIAYAKMIDVISASEHRKVPCCEIYHTCGGCSLLHMDYPEELSFKLKKVEDHVKRIARLDLDIDDILGSSDHFRYRNKVQFPVGLDKNNNVTVGFYKRQSNEIVPCIDCKIQPEFVRHMCKLICRWANRYHIYPYNKLIKTGILRHIYIRTSFKTNQTLVVIVVSHKNLPHVNELIQNLTSVFPSITGIMLNVNNTNSNIILGRRYITLYGNEYLTDVLCGKEFRISPQSFYQINPYQTEKLYEYIREFLQPTPKDTIIDLYCGTGTIGISIAEYVKDVIGIEIVPQAIQNAKINAQINNIDNISFICSDASKGMNKLIKNCVMPSAIIVDPPRKGLDIDTINATCQIKPDKIIYVSCNSATMARDIAIFKDNGYNLLKYTAVDMFPSTEHVECVCLLSKK